MRIIECEQGTDEWHKHRAGKITASRLTEMMAKRKDGKPSAMRATYRSQLAAERMKGKPSLRTFKSGPMIWGSEREAEAADLYEFRAGLELVKVGLVLHPAMDFAAASPDRLAGADGIVQFKCPNTETHMTYWETNEIDRDYVIQMQWELACTGRAWCDFVSFDPDMPERSQLYVKRFERDSVAIVGIEAEVRAFNAEIEARVQWYRDRDLIGDNLAAAA